MGYYDSLKNVQEYNKMAEGYDGRGLIEVLTHHLVIGSSVLEIGMGPGKDLDILNQHYRVSQGRPGKLIHREFDDDDSIALVLKRK